jgi:hypothetical protein
MNNIANYHNIVPFRDELLLCLPISSFQNVRVDFDVCRVKFLILQLKIKHVNLFVIFFSGSCFFDCTLFQEIGNYDVRLLDLGSHLFLENGSFVFFSSHCNLFFHVNLLLKLHQIQHDIRHSFLLLVLLDHIPAALADGWTISWNFSLVASFGFNSIFISNRHAFSGFLFG